MASNANPLPFFLLQITTRHSNTKHSLNKLHRVECKKIHIYINIQQIKIKPKNKKQPYNITLAKHQVATDLRGKVKRKERAMLKAATTPSQVNRNVCYETLRVSRTVQKRMQMSRWIGISYQYHYPVEVYKPIQGIDLQEEAGKLSMLIQDTLQIFKALASYIRFFIIVIILLFSKVLQFSQYYLEQCIPILACEI